MKKKNHFGKKVNGLSKKLLLETNDYLIYQDEWNETILQEKERESVLIVALKENHIILIKQYRSGIDEFIIQLPGGGVKKGETIVEAAKRELLEETGFIAESFDYLGYMYPFPSVGNSITHYMFTNDIISKKEQQLEENENIQVELIPIPQLMNQLSSEDGLDSELMFGISRALFQKKLSWKF